MKKLRALPPWAEHLVPRALPPWAEHLVPRALPPSNNDRLFLPNDLLL